MAAVDYVLNFNDITKTGLSLSFTVFNQVSDDSSLIAPTILELSNGFYKFSYDIALLNTDIYYVATDGGSNILTGSLEYINLPSINDLILRILGLNHENIYIDNTIYDGNNNLLNCRIRIYSNNTDVGTNLSVIATYNMISTYVGNNLNTFEVVIV